MSKPLSRRLFGKAMAAVPLAVSEAPKLAHGMSANKAAGLLSGAMPGTPARDYSAKDTAQPISEAAWREMRRKELQSIIDGKEDDFNREINGAPYVAHHYDSLKSISPGMRAVLFHRENARRAKLDRISWAQRELANLVRKFF